jgi:hypothetical protein
MVLRSRVTQVARAGWRVSSTAPESQSLPWFTNPWVGPLAKAFAALKLVPKVVTWIIGEWLCFTPRKFLYGSGFTEGRAVFTVRDQEGDHKLLIDRQGRVIVGPGENTAISGIEGGLSTVVKDGEVGLTDRDGRITAPPGEYSQIMEPDPSTLYLGEKDGVFYAISSVVKTTKLPGFCAVPLSYRGNFI